MNRAVEVLRGAGSSIRQRFSAATSQSERTIMLGIILLGSAVSAATAFVLAQYFFVDVFSSHTVVPEDCFIDWGTQVGRHCFSDYALPVGLGMRPNPWEPYPLFLPWGDYQLSMNNYPAAGMLPHLLFGVPAHWLGAPRLGLFGYLVALAIAVLAPALWAARGARGVERVVVLVALGVAAIPAWAVIDRGNSVGFVVPIALVFLVALCRQRWRLVAVMVVLAALVKPQFVVLAVVLFAARQWRLGGITLGTVVISNFAAYLLWPRDFPDTVVQSFRAILGSYGSFDQLVGGQNVSFAKSLLVIPDNVAAHNAGGTIPDGFLAAPRELIGYGVLVLVVICVLVLGRRIPPVLVGITLLATASLSPALSNFYYLVFALPVAALVARDPDGPPGSGMFDRPAILGDRRRAVGVCVSLAAALSIAQLTLPLPPIQVEIAAQMGATGVIGTRWTVPTTVGVVSVLWLIACAAIIVSYARKPAPGVLADASDTVASAEPTPASQGSRQ